MQNANDTVFEYLIDQLRQQVNKKDVTSFNVSVQISDLDEVKQVIHNLQQHIAGKDDEIRVLKDQLRQQVNNNQCEDLAHEVLSLKNQLRDASAQIKELREDNIKKSEHISHLTGQVKELHLALVEATGDVEAFKLIRKGGVISVGPTPSEPLPGCINCSGAKKEECRHEFVPSKHRTGFVCFKCGARKECEHEWRVVQYSAGVETNKCRLCGEEKEVRYEQSGCRKDDTQECEHDWCFYNGGALRMCRICGLKK